MKDSITTIMIPPSTASLNAVFLTERGLKKKLAMLAGVQTVNDDQTTTACVEAMIYREDKKAWFRAKEASGFLGVEFVDHPADWSSHTRDFEMQNQRMEQEAAQIVNAINNDRSRYQQPQQQVQQHEPQYAQQPVNTPHPSVHRSQQYPPPPQTLPDGSPWKPVPAIPPRETPAAPLLSEKQEKSRLFKW